MTNAPRILTWWLTGLPAAGKTTLARALRARLEAAGQTACLLDGDEIRQGLCRDLGFAPADRAENMRRVAELARLLNQSTIHAVVALVSPTTEGRANARRIVGDEHFIEIHVSTALAVCQARDPKGLYARALAQPGMGLTGLDAPYEAPAAPDARIDTELVPTSAALDIVLAAAAARGWSGP